MITSSGCICDVCGKYILPIGSDRKVHVLRVDGIEGDLHCCDTCKQKLEEAKTVLFEEQEEIRDWYGYEGDCIF